MPDFPVVDTHLHLWAPGRLNYAWLAGVPKLNRDFLIEDYRKACGAVHVAKMVFVQCDCAPAQAWAEVEWVAEVAQHEPRLRGIVAGVALEKGVDAEPEIARLATQPLVKGVRRLIQGERDPEFCLQPDFVHGVQQLHAHGLSFDLGIKHAQLAATIRLVRQCPDVAFVLDHIGKPDIKAGRLDPWREELRELSKLQNLWCKLSGLATAADHERWTPAHLRPYLDHVIACFGFDRVMFGSDWPVSTLATDFPRWVATLDEALRGCSAAELRKVWVPDCFLLSTLNNSYALFLQ